ncbi:MAG: hypothetical protein AAGA96_06120 [Verrucomicrobiota bacterium]
MSKSAKIWLIALAVLLAIEISVLVTRSLPSKEAKPEAESVASRKAPEASPQSGKKNLIPPVDTSTPPATKGFIRREYFGIDPLPLDFQSPAFEPREDGRVLKKDVANQLADLNDPDQDPIEDIQILNSTVASYRQIFRENPIAGENREVVEALTGNNPYQLMLIDPAHPAINSSNEIVDRWNVPYRFHAVSRDQMEIVSAGEDRQFGTGDDIMIDEPVQFGPPSDFEELDE